MSNELATQLANLKERTHRSYAALARQIGVSSSALHRYCTGTGVPVDFRVVQRMGRTCGADRRELVDLHQAWLIATARREPTTIRPVGAVIRSRTGFRRWGWFSAAAAVAATVVALAAMRRPVM